MLFKKYYFSSRDSFLKIRSFNWIYLLLPQPQQIRHLIFLYIYNPLVRGFFTQLKLFYYFSNCHSRPVCAVNYIIPTWDNDSENLVLSCKLCNFLQRQTIPSDPAGNTGRESLLNAAEALSLLKNASFQTN